MIIIEFITDQKQDTSQYDAGERLSQDNMYFHHLWYEIRAMVSPLWWAHYGCGYLGTGPLI